MTSNRQERRRAKALARRANRPLARLGVVIHTGTARAVRNTPDGPRDEFYWWASENGNMTQEEMEQLELHGPFDTDAEADAAARLAVVGPDCKITEGGQWNPAWDKPQ